MGRGTWLAMVGTALYASWPFAAFYTDTLFVFGGLDDWARDLFWKLSLGFLILGFLVQAVLGRRLDRAFFEGSWQRRVSVVFVGGNLLIVTAGLFGGAYHDLGACLGCAGAALAGFSSAFFEVGWRAVLYRYDRDAVDVNIAFTSVLSRLVIILFAVFDSPVSSVLLLVVVVGSPVLMGLCTWMLRRKGERDGLRRPGDLPESVRSARLSARLRNLEPLLWCGIIVASFWFAYCVLENMTIPSRMRNYPVLAFSMGAGCLLSFVVAMAFLLFRRSLSFATVLRDGVVAMAAVLLVAALALPVEKSVLYIAGSAIQLAVSIMLWISGISFMHERGVSFARVQSAIRLFLYIGVLGASMAWPMLQRCDAGTTLLVLTVVLLGVTVIALGRIVDADHLHSPDFVADEAAGAIGPEAPRPSKAAAHGIRCPQPAVLDEREQRIGQVAARFGLSPREQEVFALLVNGRDSVFIRNQLYISKNTVGTHIKSIYRKLGVHSRQELIDVFESGRR